MGIAHILTTGIYFALILGIMVLVHEFGHFAVAKLCGVRVEAFAIGFGKKIFGFRRGETEYRLNLLPLGGYVKMSGEIPGEATSNDPGEFGSHPRWQRMLIALAGPVSNFILALVIMTVVAMFHHEVAEYLTGTALVDQVTQNSPASRAGISKDDTIVHYDSIENPSWQDILIRSVLNLNRTVPVSYLHDGKRVDSEMRIDAPSDPDKFNPTVLGFTPRMQQDPVVVADLPDANAPAAKAGVKPGDRIETIDGLQFHSVEALAAYLKSQNGKTALLGIGRNGTTLSLPIQPVAVTAQDGSKQFRFGFIAARESQKIVHLPFAAAVAESWKSNVKLSFLIVDVFKGMFTRRVSMRSMSGPIGIAQQVGIASDNGIWTVLELMASISVNLGIFNLMPFPILDGGMILFLLIESVMRRDLKPQLKERIYQTAFVFIIIFAAFVIFNDISKLTPFLHSKT